MAVTRSFDLIRGTEFDASVAPPSDQAPSNEFDSDVTALPDGGFAVAYQSPSNGLNRPVFALNGTKSVFPFGDDDFIRNAEGTPVITALKRSDSIAIVWKEGGNGGDNTIYSSVYSPTFNAFVAQEVSITTNTALRDPAVTAFADGSFGIVANDGASVYFQKMNKNGTVPAGSAPVVIANIGSGFGIDINPDVATLSDDRFVVTYRNGTTIEARIFDANGNLQPPVRGAVVADVGTGGSAKVTAYTDGSFIVAYKDTSETPGIFVRAFSSQGVGGPVVQIDDLIRFPPYEVADPQITALKDGFFVVTFTLAGNAFGRVIDANGQRVGEAFEIDPSLGATQTAVAALQDGKFVTTWTDSFHGDGDGGRISGQVNELVQNIVSDGDSDFIQGGALRDIVRAGGGADIILGAAGRDDLSGDAGDDVFQVDKGDVVDGETYDGGGDNDILQLRADGFSPFDFRKSTVVNIETLALTSGVTAVFTADQFDQFFAVDFGGDGADASISILMGDATSLNLSGLNFTGSPDPDAGFRIFGDSSDETINGSSFADSISADVGSDLLNGLGGADTMVGGTGDDTYIVDDAGDSIFENADAGFDTVRAGVSYTLGAGQSIELLQVLSQSDRFETYRLTGNELNQELQGSRGSDFLDGKGGADTMRGGEGDDTYYVDDARDRVFDGDIDIDGDGEGDGVNAGRDRVFTSVSYKLAAEQQIEVLSTTRISGTDAIKLTGNEFAQSIDGNDGTNTLDGRGGADKMRGFGGNDTYAIDDSGDAVIEAAGGGKDRVLTSVSYKLTAGQEIESFSTTSVTGTDAIKLVGNEFGQLIYGNDGANTLDGRGGADTMRGYKGADTYVVDDTRDVVVEAAGGGSDRVLTSGTYTLAGGQEIETLSAANVSDTAGLRLTGNAFGQAINGNNGANLIDGKEGADLLRGFAGKDFFAFTTALGAGNVDRILDFSSADDTIRLENAIFTALTATGPLSSSAFKEIGVPGAVVDDTDRILYNSSTGALSYDADGSGSTAAILFARLDTAPTLTFQDFVVS